MAHRGWAGAGLALAAMLLAARAEPGDVRKAKAYLTEVKKHLLQSYIDRERMKDETLVRAAVRAMSAAMDHDDFAALDRDARAAVKEGLRNKDRLEDALAAVEEKAPQADLIKLADHAAQAMVKETGDPFSRILTQDDMNQLLKLLQGGGRDDHSGCAVQIKEGRGTVAYVQYGYPAYECGLEIGDEILEIGGRKVGALKPEALHDLLRVPADGALELKVRRHGRDYDFRILPRAVKVKDVRAEYLGQGVGYLRLTVFDLGLVGEVRRSLRELQSQGMKGLILDLRHNPGGALPAATGVADLFLEEGLLITKTVSHYTPSLGGLKIPGFGGDQDFVTKTRSDFERVPMVCLVNGASASASELLAGALKDHRRAVLVGEKTYGKGVGQSPIFLTSMFMKRYLYLTVMRYTTPNGHDVDHKGVEPDVAFSEERPSPDAFDALMKVRGGGTLRKYVAERWGPGLRKLAHYDGFETAGYDGFDGLYASLSTPLTRDQVRQELRREARRKAEDEGKVWMCDLQSDRVLQRGLVEVLDRLEK